VILEWCGTEVFRHLRSFENGGYLEISKATKIVEDSYPLQSGHIFTTTNQMSMILNKMPVFDGLCGWTVDILK
jgi:hypothetical protein